MRGAAVSQGIAERNRRLRPAAGDQQQLAGARLQPATSARSAAAPSAPFHVRRRPRAQPRRSATWAPTSTPWWTTYWGTVADMVDWFLADYAAALTLGDRAGPQIQNAAVSGGRRWHGRRPLRRAAARWRCARRSAAPSWSTGAARPGRSSRRSPRTATSPRSTSSTRRSPRTCTCRRPTCSCCWRRSWTTRSTAAGPKTVRGARPRFQLPERVRAQRRQRGGHAGRGVRQHADHDGRAARSGCPRRRRRPPSRRRTTRSCKQWADYLVANALDPATRTRPTTSPASSPTASNLALKGIIGIGAMGVVAGFAGNTADQASTLDRAQLHQPVGEQGRGPGRHQPRPGLRGLRAPGA